MCTRPIDVWDMRTFDPSLLTELEAHTQLVRDYMQRDQQIFLAHDLGRSEEIASVRPTNPWGAQFQLLKEQICRQMRKRTIRAWHYARMTDEEADEISRKGVHLSTKETLRHRLEALTGSGLLSTALASKIYDASPFHSDQHESRSGKFWMVSHPLVTSDGGVELLLANWGGEVAYFWAKDSEHQEAVAKIGKARVVELAVPLAATRQTYRAGEAVLATFARSLGCPAEKHCFDLYTIEPLEAAAVLAVHTQGRRPFDEIGRDYPSGYIDVSVGWWKELTGEED